MWATSWRVRRRHCALHLLRLRLSHFCCGSPRRRSSSLPSLDTLPSRLRHVACFLVADCAFLCSPQTILLEAISPGVVGPA